ncbi:MAG: GrpB family protein [Actinomycetota bacterium]|nr:GrpB family protein [Actinomycetota bacterium]
MEEIAQQAQDVVTRFVRDNADILDADVHHIGATAMPFGHTKGDVDVNVRVEETRFPGLVTALRERFDVAQHENWTPAFASFSTDRYALPLGIQVTVSGSEGDFLLRLRDRMLAQPDLLREYDQRKLSAAARGAAAYWDAKNSFLRELLAR